MKNNLAVFISMLDCMNRLILIVSMNRTFLVFMTSQLLDNKFDIKNFHLTVLVGGLTRSLVRIVSCDFYAVFLGKVHAKSKLVRDEGADENQTNTVDHL